MVVIVALLQSRGTSVYSYLDNWLLVADSRDLLLHHIELSVSLQCSLGIQVDYQKLHLTPSQSVHFIGAILNTLRAKVFLFPDRTSKILQLIHSIHLHSPWVLQIQCLL